MAEPSAVPTRKVTTGFAAGSIMTIAAWASGAYAGVEIPAYVALAGATVITFVLQYMVSEPSDPAILPPPQGTL